MKLSTKGEYGLLAVIDLALHSGRGPVQSFQIAERQNIPKQYLDQLLLMLKKAGLIESSRGRQGGYQLARAAQEITLFDIVTALEGPIENVNFVGKSKPDQNPTQEILKDIWIDLVSHTVGILKQKTLEEFCDRQRRIQEQFMYYI
ncbi:MAG: Rrf2 family transcriptional regulator [Acidobacteria bacterium]|nr:Rrf2 family transcriptional regulator [Acidobacteriota bacterium]MCI0621751.1 Rrf2 family transcriptional regulator [Acidobacteriota bacterium]MCI0718361.1 Rrf2 family transcriptional regulator [Acidobacteriota bacterium]